MSLKGAFSTYVTFISYKLGWLYEFYLHLGIRILNKNIKPLHIYINKALILTVHSLKFNDQKNITFSSMKYFVRQFITGTL